ncbi:pyruvate decarboxylase [Athelia psychrophila]|uniref:Pyruvate decarboxylase n=1 Tax=Athelia psychrophila TaxID=1759441 RepID=A0A166WAX7_9AGAM|nr:pyruvate decarboxylase [Fibularhizoctonia sp. CBS 109695]
MSDITSLQAEVKRLQSELNTLDVGGEKITVSEYLLKRLEQLGVKHMFGVPGDFNLAFLDYVEDSPAINWVGNCNELNAAYAADGYARVNEHSIGVITTTFGVGELSAINGIAGAFSEMVPILHIAGVPSTDQQLHKTLLHHTLGDGRFDAYRKASDQFTIAQADITSAATAGAQIDYLLTELITHVRPVYLTLPTNMVAVKISSASLSIPLTPTVVPNDPETEKFVLEEIAKLAKVAEESDDGKDGVVILVDACAIRHGVRDEVKELAEKTGFPVYAAPMGKTAIDEDWERYGGIYLGSLTAPAIKERIENARLIISVGSLKSDFNTGNFTYRIPTRNTVELHSGHTTVQYASFPGIGMKELLPKLSEVLATHRASALKISVPHYRAVVPQDNEKSIMQDWFWPRMAQWFKPKDVIVSETGTSNFGLLDVPLPAQSIFVSQILWGSIGWATGSALGAAIAAQDRGLGRTMLFIGDGSVQLSAQEIATMVKLGLKPILFILNNEGYTIERCIHGKRRKYNDIQNWNWPELLKFFGDDAKGEKSRSYTVRTKEELEALLADATFVSADKIQLVEVIMDKYDAPRALRYVCFEYNAGLR